MHVTSFRAHIVDKHQTLWPLCTIIVKDTFCVLASSATSEGSFSQSGHIMRSRRWRLSDAHVQELSFISWNADLLESWGVWPEVVIGASGFKFVGFICIVYYLSS